MLTCILIEGVSEPIPETQPETTSSKIKELISADLNKMVQQEQVSCFLFWLHVLHSTLCILGETTESVSCTGVKITGENKHIRSIN